MEGIDGDEEGVPFMRSPSSISRKALGAAGGNKGDAPSHSATAPSRLLAIFLGVLAVAALRSVTFDSTITRDIDLDLEDADDAEHAVVDAVQDEGECEYLLWASNSDGQVLTPCEKMCIANGTELLSILEGFHDAGSGKGREDDDDDSVDPDVMTVAAFAVGLPSTKSENVTE